MMCALVWHKRSRGGIAIWEGPIAYLMFAQFPKTNAQAKASHSASSSSSSTSQSVTNDGRRLQAVVVDACVHSTPGRMKTMAADPQTISNPCPGPRVWPHLPIKFIQPAEKIQNETSKFQVSKVKLSVHKCAEQHHPLHSHHVYLGPTPLTKETEAIICNSQPIISSEPTPAHASPHQPRLAVDHRGQKGPLPRSVKPAPQSSARRSVTSCGKGH